MSASASSASSSSSTNIEGISKTMLDSLVKKTIEKEMHRRLSKAKWIAITGLIRRLCLYHGIIYGGAVRSYIQRSLASQGYYTFCKENNIDADENYCNPEVHPESFENRNIFPADIDVFMSEKDLKRFMEQGGGDKEYHLTKKSHSGANYFFESNELFKKALCLQKYECNIIHFCNSVLSTIIFGGMISFNSSDFKLRIDIVVIKDEYTSEHHRRIPITANILYPPFGNPDFDVNLLCFKVDDEDSLGNFVIKPLPILKRLLASNIDAREDKLLIPFKPFDDYFLTKSILEDIITGIRTKRARPVYPILEEYRTVFGREKSIAIDGHRIIKMLERGFSFDPFNLILEPALRNSIIWAPADYQYDDESTPDSDREKCIICYDTFSATNRWFKCCTQCNGKMHQTCITKYLKSIHYSAEGVDCPHCRTHISRDNCPCKFISFFNAIDYVISSFSHIGKRHKRCDDCRQVISIYTTRACECHIIDCRCKHAIATRIDEIE